VLTHLFVWADHTRVVHEHPIIVEHSALLYLLLLLSFLFLTASEQSILYLVSFFCRSNRSERSHFRRCET
jgi:hypothetical protein